MGGAQMVDFISRPAIGHGAVTHGTLTLSEGAQTDLWAIMPYHGQQAAVSDMMQTHHGLCFPQPGQSCCTGDIAAIWAGLNQAVLVGARPHASLGAQAALVDQSDAWAHLILQGAGMGDVLARLTPIDLRPKAFAVGHVARSTIGHMNAVIWRRDEDRFDLFTFRSMGAYAWDEITHIMAHLAARAAIGHDT